MKWCASCQVTKPLDDFHRATTKKGGQGRQSICKICRAARDKARTDHVRRAALRDQRRIEIAAWARSLKAGKSCTDCGGTFHHAAMQWDHIGDDKIADISEMSNRGVSRSKILMEIAKCELVCANCHSVRTYERRVALQRAG